jgi:amidase
MAHGQPWKAIAERKQKQRQARIPKEWLLKSVPSNRDNILDEPRKCGILSRQEIRITEWEDATGLLEELTSGRLKSIDVVTAFCKRAAIAQQLVSELEST